MYNITIKFQKTFDIYFSRQKALFDGIVEGVGVTTKRHGLFFVFNFEELIVRRSFLLKKWFGLCFEMGKLYQGIKYYYCYILGNSLLGGSKRLTTVVAFLRDILLCTVFGQTVSLASQIWATTLHIFQR